MAATPPPSQAKHARIARALEQDLAQGKYRVGATLPSEPALTQQFGVSRHTVRAALRTLQERGLIASQQGLGSVVRATTTTLRYTQGFASAEDLLQYVASTRVLQLDKHEIVVNAELAAWLGCKPGERWWKLTVLRCAASPSSDGQATSSGAGDDRPTSLADVYLPDAYGASMAEELVSNRPIFRFIEEQLGEPISEIRQDINAVMPTAQEAAALQVAPGEPALAIVRRYLGKHGQVLETTRTLHPGAQFTYTMNLRLAPQRDTG